MPISQGAKISALFEYPVVRVQVVSDTQKTRLASVVLLVKIWGVEIPETVDAVGVSPTASKPFGLFGASGDIGFTPKASDINGLRAIEQQYLHQKPNISFGFWGRSSDGASFFLAPKQGKESLAVDKIFPYIIL